MTSRWALAGRVVGYAAVQAWRGSDGPFDGACPSHERCAECCIQRLGGIALHPTAHSAGCAEAPVPVESGSVVALVPLTLDAREEEDQRRRRTRRAVGGYATPHPWQRSRWRWVARQRGPAFAGLFRRPPTEPGVPLSKHPALQYLLLDRDAHSRGVTRMDSDVAVVASDESLSMACGHFLDQAGTGLLRCLWRSFRWRTW
jgi:hypothetical protein